MNILEDKINLLHNFVYSEDKFNSKVGKIDIENINMSDIKILKDADSEEYNDTISSLFTGKFKEIYFDDKNNTLLLKRYTEGFNIGLYVTPYKSKDSIEDLSNFNNNDSLFSYLLSYLSLNNMTKHILLPIINIDVSFSQFEDIISKANNYDIIKKKLNDNEISDLFSIRVRENFFKSMTLTEYISSNQCDLKKLLFQVIHTLAVIQNEYRNFRHNNLSPDNIIVYLKKSASEYDVYHFNDKKYHIPKNKFIIKIGNFNYSSIPDYYGNSIKIPFGNKNNHYFDLHFFLNSLLDKIDISGCDENTTNFINKIIPEKYRSSNNNYYMERNVELYSPAQLIEDEFFAEYTNVKNNTMMMDSDRDEYVYGNRRINSKKSSRKSSKLKRKNISTEESYNQKGGNMVVKDPNPVMNNPFVTNTQRQHYAANREQIEIKKPNNIIAQQTVKKNPHYINPMRLRPKKINTWEHGYQGGAEPMDKFYVPKGTVQTGEPKDISKESTKDNESDKYSNAGDFVPRVKPHYNKDNDKPNYDKHKPNYDKPNYDKPNYDKPNYDKPNYDKSDKFKPKYRDTMTTESEEEIPSRESPRPQSPHRDNTRDNSRPYSPHRDTPRDTHRDTPREKFERNNTYNPANKPYKAKYETNVTQQPLLAEQKVYQPAMPMGGAANHTHPKNYQPAFVDIYNNQMYPSPFIPEYNYMPPGYPIPNLYKPNQIPLQNVYNISLGNPGEGHSQLNSIYEDILPMDQHTLSYSSLKERFQLTSFLRNSINKRRDGEDMTLQAGKGNESLLSYISVLQFNPYYNGATPYHNIPIDFMIYNAAYPLKYNADKSRLEIAKFASGLNIRIYNLSVAAKNVDKISGLSHDNFDLWREFKYYEYVRESILKTKESPNFISLITHKFDKHSKLKYEELNRIIKQHKSNDNIKNNNSILNGVIKSISSWNNKDLNPESITEPNKDSGESLIILTEAPTTSMKYWMSKIYQQNAARREMKNTGYHNSKIWKSVLFQLIHSMYVLQKHKIYFRNFSIENNVFIKDLFANPSNIGHWVYKVNGVEYFVPNFGYLVMIDSRYIDVDTDYENIILNRDRGTTTEYKYKLLSPIFDIQGKEPISDYNMEIFEQFKEAINYLNNNSDITKPDQDVIDLLKNINTEIASGNTDISYYITKFFGSYLHTKVGNHITSSERPLLSINKIPKLLKGDMVVYQRRYEEYVWAVYLEDNGKKKTLLVNRDGNADSIKDVFPHSLCEYNGGEVLQTYRDNYKLNSDHRLDIYSI